MKHLILSLSLVAALLGCGSDVVEPGVKGVGGLCIADLECAAGLACVNEHGRGICAPRPRDGAVSLAPDASRTFGGVGAPCDSAADCLGGLDCRADGDRNVCALPEGDGI